MTETEARQFIKRFEDLCLEYENVCKCRIDFSVVEKKSGTRNLKWIVINDISLKID